MVLAERVKFGCHQYEWHGGLDCQCYDRPTLALMDSSGNLSSLQMHMKRSALLYTVSPKPSLAFSTASDLTLVVKPLDSKGRQISGYPIGQKDRSGGALGPHTIQYDVTRHRNR